MATTLDGPSPALRERVPSNARRVRVRRSAPSRQATALRRNTTDAERRLWAALRSRRLAGYKFRRQHPIGRFIVDFACTKHGLIIEADGGQHDESMADAHRTAWLESKGWRVLRFWNNDILVNTEGVVSTILEALRVG
jgi:very-short-patch-repair endonuclease